MLPIVIYCVNYIYLFFIPYLYPYLYLLLSLFFFDYRKKRGRGILIFFFSFVHNFIFSSSPPSYFRLMHFFSAFNICVLLSYSYLSIYKYIVIFLAKINMNVSYNQDNINLLSNFILENSQLYDLVKKEDWKSLFLTIYSNAVAWYNIDVIKSSKLYNICMDYSFLYRYFLDLDNFDILTCTHYVPTGAFQDSPVSEIVLPDNITHILFGAFMYSYLRKITIPKHCARIAESAFNYLQSSSLEIIYGGSKKSWSSILMSEPQNTFRDVNVIVHCSDGDIRI